MTGINITDAAFIRRQFAMRGLNLTPAKIKAAMSFSDEKLAGAIAHANDLHAAATGDRKAELANLTKALLIEADLRKK